MSHDIGYDIVLSDICYYVLSCGIDQHDKSSDSSHCVK